MTLPPACSAGHPYNSSARGPVLDGPIHIADDDGIMREIKQVRLLAQGSFCHDS